MGYETILEITRGEIVESLHHGAVAVADASGNLHAWFGDPGIVTYLRSSAKPIQTLSLIESGAAEYFGFSSKQIAVVSASHSGTDAHVETVESILEAIDATEDDLLCGVHPPLDTQTAQRLRDERREVTACHHNCSGKHAGMLATARYLNESITDYVQAEHPLQQRILKTLAEMTSVDVGSIGVAIDGCSVPTFAVSLHAAATAYARLVDPGLLSPKRSQACHAVVSAMTSHPDMVAGQDRFDTRLMRLAEGRVISKGGAEGFQSIGILPGVLGKDSPGLGIALKVADGDSRGRVRPITTMAVLRTLGALTDETYAAFVQDVAQITNHRGHVVGRLRPTIRLVRGIRLKS